MVGEDSTPNGRAEWKVSTFGHLVLDNKNEVLVGATLELTSVDRCNQTEDRLGDQMSGQVQLRSFRQSR